MLTPEEYAKREGKVCPICGADTNDNADYGSIDFESYRVFQRVDCSACGSQWYDAYILDGYEDLEKG